VGVTTYKDSREKKEPLTLKQNFCAEEREKRRETYLLLPRGRFITRGAFIPSNPKRNKRGGPFNLSLRKSIEKRAQKLFRIGKREIFLDGPKKLRKKKQVSSLNNPHQPAGKKKEKGEKKARREA